MAAESSPTMPRSLRGIRKSHVSRMCGEIDERVHAFLARPINQDFSAPPGSAARVYFIRTHWLRVQNPAPHRVRLDLNYFCPGPRSVRP
jgi:hypothetical protein